MGKFEDMIDGLQQDSDVPEDVWEKYTDTLANLPDKEGKRGWVKYAASAAALAVLGAGVCFSNPTLAAKIPFIGEIFEKIEGIPTFSGDYDDKAETLTTEGEEASDSEYIVENAGVTFSASEVYCDGLSVFLTAKVEIEQGGLNNMSGEMLYLDGEWRTDGESEGKMMENNNLEGKVIDDQTFIGMLKLDLDDKDLQNGTVELDLSMIGYDDINDLNEESNEAFHKIKGEWRLSIPFSVDREAVKTFQPNQEKDGYCLKEIFVSPYQVITYTDVPYTENEITYEEFEAAMKEKTGDSGEFVITYEEYAEQAEKIYEECFTHVFNQIGERIPLTEEYQGRSVSAVQGKEITRLYIYVFDNIQGWGQMYEQGMNSETTAQALISAEIDVR